ncbi:78977645-7e35-44a7-bb3f-ea4bbb5d8841 [Thermothielavioides terrestris]|uniref:78977645-7e35-44a7-bb3f-ea4bbb5d8841 n=1 Tax=Thermothielavioides terrestris TaxID=2587410 RepID=A0A446B7A8_9PEZI|nr:78977645-7e35-44a7-bb3f-ea4bbb5d8841 [Thermothielavioides terrestris]
MRLHTLHELDKTEGTVQLRRASSSPTGPAGETSSTASLVLFPTPSATDPNDPLRWPRWKKHTAFLSVCAFTFLTNYGIGGLAPAFYPLSLEFGRTASQTSALLLWPILVLGACNFLWVPLANYLGKRPVFVVCCGLLCASLVWGAVARSFESLLWSNIVGAFAGSSTEALGASIVNDLYFLHERGAMMGVYTAFISGGNSIGPLVCGFVVTGLSWRWHKWIALILTGINFVTVLFFVPETRYYRAESLGPLDVASSSRENMNASTDAEKDANGVVSEGEVTEQRDTVPKKTWLQELRVWSGVTPDTNIVLMFVRPLPLFAYPCVIYAFLGYAVSLALTASVNMLNSFVLQAPPYSWPAMINGLINIPGLLGNLTGCIAGGWLVDKFWCILFGYGVERTLHWTSLFFGYGMISVALTAIPTTTMAYVSDCVLPVNSDALMLVNGSKNIVAFGFLYGVVPWVDRVGYVDCFGTQAGIFVAVIGLGMLLLIPFGEKIRHVQARWRIIL